MNIKQVLPEPDLYRAVMPDDPDIMQKPLQGPKKGRRAFEKRLGYAETTNHCLTALGPSQGPTGATGPVGSEEKGK